MAYKWPKFEEVVGTKAPKSTAVKSGVWPSFDDVVQPPKPVLNKQGFDVSKNIYNPLNPNNQLNQPQDKVSIFKETFKPSNLGGATKKIFSGTAETIHEIKVDPLTLKAKPKQALKDMWSALKEPVKQEAINIRNLFDLNKPMSNSETVATGIKTLTGLGNIAFSPISALFSGANQIPVLGTISKAVSLPFEAAGEAGAGLANGIVNKLPISQKAKDNINPALQEIFSLAGQILLGKGADAVKVKGLEKKYGVEDTKVILEKAQEFADNKIKSEFPKSDPTPPEIKKMVETKQLGAPEAQLQLEAPKPGTPKTGRRFYHD